MFKNPGARYALRIVIVAALAGLAALRASVEGGLDASEIVNVAEATLGAGAAYAGIGALTGPVEPHISRKLKG
jgi:hypothetical protein